MMMYARYQIQRVVVVLTCSSLFKISPPNLYARTEPYFRLCRILCVSQAFPCCLSIPISFFFRVDFVHLLADNLLSATCAPTY